MTTTFADPPATGLNLSNDGHTDPADDPLYHCRVCDDQLPASLMSKSRKRGLLHIYGKCLRCVNAHKRERERQIASAPRGPDGTLVEAVVSSDPWPARLLAELLREDRDRWRFNFDPAWSEDLAFVLAQIPQCAERSGWRRAFETTRATWEAAWSNTPAPGRVWRLSSG